MLFAFGLFLDKRMTPLDALLLVLYGLVVYRVLTQAIEKLNKQAIVSLNQGQLNEELGSRELAGMVAFNFGFKNPYSLTSALKMLAISIANTSEQTLYIDWDRSSLTNFGGRSRRVIRLTPDKSPDLIRAQVLSVIPPGQVLQEVITAEDVLSRAAESDPLEPTGVIVPIAGATEDNPLRFYLCIWLVVQQASEGGNLEDRSYLIPAEFLIRKSPWTDALPW